MNKKLISSLLIVSFLSSPVAIAKQTREKRHPLISKKDHRLEKKNFKEQLAAEKAAEKAARKEWKKVTDFEKEQSPWTTWYRKKIVPALLQLSKLRKSLYRDNVFDSYLTRPEKADINCGAYQLENRTIDGTCNDMEDKMMGAVWTRFGRNIDPQKSFTDESMVLYPNPRKISRELLTRDEFKPVPFLNLLAVGWIQFMTHDWFSHGDNESPDKAVPYYIPLEAGDPLGDVMMIPRSMVDNTRTRDEDKKLPKTFLNENTHWWDASQVYGSEEKVAKSLRTFKDGQLEVVDGKYLPQTLLGIPKTGLNRNWWLGLSLMHHVFALEHNAIAKELKKKYPEMNDQQLYDKARMINAALIAKIHSIEWTPAILPNRTLRTAMNANWKGLANGSYKVKPWYELFKNDFLFGIVGGKKDLSDVPFHMTEEFTSVYRMHNLLPDELKMQTLSRVGKVKEYSLSDVREDKSEKVLKEYGLENALYSFGRMNPGQLTLKNFPKTLQNIEIPFSPNVDLAAIDIVRDRERGVPRYNEFRRQLKMKPITKFEDLTDDQEMVAKLKDVYDNNIELIDLLVGCLAEAHRPTGYGFGETAFQVFIIMASRRLVADRFFTENYNAKTYTKLGIKWVDENNFKTVLLRHFPQLQEALFGVGNAFNPWNKVE